MEIPGFFDLQVNGFAGVDFNDPGTTVEEVGRAADALRRTGVTRFLVALITAPLDAFARCARTIAACGHPAVAGIHMEGPYLAAEGRGVHPAGALAPASEEDFDRRQEAAGGRIRLVTLAPEVPGALRLVARLRARGVAVAIGHSAASPAEIRAAVDAGATLSTHLGNGGPARLPKQPNLLWEQLAADELFATLIVDGHHLAPSTVKAMSRAKGPSRTILVTDAVAAAGCPPGPFRLGGLDVDLRPDGRVTLAGAETLAGSALTMDAAVGYMVRFSGLPLVDVLPMASLLPAAAVGEAPAGQVTARWDAEAFRLEVLSVRA